MKHPPINDSFVQQASHAFGQLVRTVTDAQLRALMRAVFYRAGRYEAFCRSPLTVAGSDSAAGSALRHTIRTGRLLRAVAGSFSLASRDLMLAAALLMEAGTTEAFAQGGAVRLTSRGALYPVAVLSTLLVHDARCGIDRTKRESLEGLMLQAAWLAGQTGVPAPEGTGAAGILEHEARVVALCMQLDRFAALYESTRVATHGTAALRWSGQMVPAPVRCENLPDARWTLIDQPRKDHDDDTTEPRLATG
ncbi:MAG: hypothetical protein FWC54_00175 [Actinomycetia bacterium]|nr:hypothetical protein [Actinomycetes bacterium]